MKSFLFYIHDGLIWAKYPQQRPRFSDDDRQIKVYYDGYEVGPIVVQPIIMPYVFWSTVNYLLIQEARKLYKQSLASVDLTPADHCQHSDDVQDVD